MRRHELDLFPALRVLVPHPYARIRRGLAEGFVYGLGLGGGLLCYVLLIGGLVLLYKARVP